MSVVEVVEEASVVEAAPTPEVVLPVVVCPPAADVLALPTFWYCIIMLAIWLLNQPPGPSAPLLLLVELELDCPLALPCEPMDDPRLAQKALPEPEPLDWDSNRCSCWKLSKGDVPPEILDVEVISPLPALGDQGLGKMPAHCRDDIEKQTPGQ